MVKPLEEWIVQILIQPCYTAILIIHKLCLYPIYVLQNFVSHKK